MWIVLTYSVLYYVASGTVSYNTIKYLFSVIRFGLLLFFFFWSLFDVKIKLQDFRARRILRLFGDVSALYR